MGHLIWYVQLLLRILHLASNLSPGHVMIFIVDALVHAVNSRRTARFRSFVLASTKVKGVG